MGFLTEDVLRAQAFGAFIKQHGRWNLTTDEAIQLTKHLAFYNSLVKKIEDHVFEVQRKIEKPSTAPEAGMADGDK